MEEKYYLEAEIDETIEDIAPKQAPFKQKPKVITQEVKQELKFSDNQHIADLQQRLIRLEYEFLMIRGKLFEESKTPNQPKLSAFGKLTKRRING